MKLATTANEGTDKTQQKLNTILLVDDDAKLLRALKRHLDDDYRVLTAISPGEAAVFLDREEIDLILCDNLMSGQLGTEFLESAGKKHPNIKLLMLSGYLPKAVAERVVNSCGVHKVLNKPCAIDEVELAIREALSHLTEDEIAAISHD